MTTASTTGPLTIVKAEETDNVDLFHTTPGSSEHANLDNLNAEFHHTTGHDHSVKGKLVPNAGLGADVARANILTNGGFEFWQRGAGAFTTNSAYTADRWQIVLGAASAISVTRDGTAGEFSSGAYGLKAVYTHAATTWIKQNVENALDYRGKTLTLSVRVKVAAAAAVVVQLEDSAGASSSTAHTGGGAFETLSVTRTIDASTTSISIYIRLAASCTVYIDDAMLCISPVAVDFVPLTYADEQARCLRYYEFQNDPQYAGYTNGAGQNLGASMSWHAVKAVGPTCAKVGATWNVFSCQEPTLASSGIHSFTLKALSTGAGVLVFYVQNAGDGVSAEAN